MDAQPGSSRTGTTDILYVFFILNYDVMKRADPKVRSIKLIVIDLRGVEKIGRGLGPVQHISGRFTVLVRYLYGTCTGKSTIDERMRDHLLYYRFDTQAIILSNKGWLAEYIDIYCSICRFGLVILTPLAKFL